MAPLKINFLYTAPCFTCAIHMNYLSLVIVTGRSKWISTAPVLCLSFLFFSFCLGYVCEAHGSILQGKKQTKQPTTQKCVNFWRVEPKLLLIEMLVLNWKVAIQLVKSDAVTVFQVFQIMLWARKVRLLQHSNCIHTSVVFVECSQVAEMFQMCSWCVFRNLDT